MEVVIKEIFDTIEDNDDVCLKDIANEMKVTTRTLHNFKNGTKNLTFPRLMKLASILYKDKEVDVINRWCYALTHTGIKHALEYASLTRNVDLLKNLLKKTKNKGGILNECEEIYSLILDFMESKKDPKSMSEYISEIKKPKDAPLGILVDIYNLIAKFHKKDFADFHKSLYEVEKSIAELKDDDNINTFYKKCFLHRLAEIASFSFLHLNDTAKTRHYACIVINGGLSAKQVAEAYFVLGFSHLQDSPNLALEYLEKSREVMCITKSPHLIECATYNIDFAKLLLKKKLDKNADKTLLAVAKVRENKELYHDLKEVVYRGGDEDLIGYFEAISGTLQELYETYSKLTEKRNYFYATVVLNEIIERGDNTGFTQHLKKNTKLKAEGESLFEKTFISNFININTISGRVYA
ncbi:AimR family lysis-lysogeny pheromone receptor [Bacillus pumilus]|uniref:AimR family lysis-lysogeny pheromone receptor n=1 Tax=Bacillus pumilus TaxID=1408 RepID=UPI0011A2627A|nr:AimR family lysis-lysogeny pheromone receptor [Bacillus pumilus]